MSDRTIDCGLQFCDRPYSDEWPMFFTGWVDHVESSYDFDDALHALVPDRLAGRVECDSEGSQIFVYAADREAAEWVERACNAISRRLAPASMSERLDGLKVE